jgi:hypothetical protein
VAPEIGSHVIGYVEPAGTASPGVGDVTAPQAPVAQRAKIEIKPNTLKNIFPIVYPLTDDLGSVLGEQNLSNNVTY